MLKIHLITTVAGNTLKLLDFFKKDIPVAKGCHRPIIKDLDLADDVHGESKR